MSSTGAQSALAVVDALEDVEEPEPNRHRYPNDYATELSKNNVISAGDDSQVFGAVSGRAPHEETAHEKSATFENPRFSSGLDPSQDSYRGHDSDTDSISSFQSETSRSSEPSAGLSETTASTADSFSSASTVLNDTSVSERPSSENSYPTIHAAEQQDEDGSRMPSCYTTTDLLMAGRFSAEALELNSVSMPNLPIKDGMVTEMKSDSDCKGIAQEDLFMHSGHENARTPRSSRQMEDGNESDGLVGRSSGDREALIAPERAPNGFPFEQTMRPVQVRKMPIWFQMLMVLSISMIGFGSYAAYDAVAAVQEPLMKDLNLSVSQFGWLYSVYALPNVVLVIFGGKLVDYWGPQRVGMMTTVSIAIGAALVAIAPNLAALGNRGRFLVMLLGRFVFGIGAESSYVVQNSMCVKWFFGDHLATAMAITAAGTRLGSIFSFVLAPHLSAQRNYTVALWAATATCVVSVLAVFGYMLLRSYARSHLLVTNFDQNSLETHIEDSPEADGIRYSRSDFEMRPLDNSDMETTVDLDQDLTEDQEVDSTPVNQQRQNFIWRHLKMTWRDLRSFSALFWGSAVLGLFTYGIVLGFRAVSGEAIAVRYKLKPERANLALATIDITGLVAAFPVGWLVDWTYQIGWITLAGNVFSVASFVLLIPVISPFAGTVLLGLSSTIVPATIYPAISYLTPQSMEGFAFGVTSAVINLGNLILNLIISRTLDISWIWMCYFLIFMSMVSVGISLWWIIKDYKSECPRLNPPRDFTPERRWLRHHLRYFCS